MGITEFFIFIIKVILLLAVILIFSYVNTKKSHIEKVEKLNKAKKIKEGAKLSLSETDKTVDKVVTDAKKKLKFQLKQDDADENMLKNINGTIERHTFLDEKKKAIAEQNKGEKKKSVKNTIEGFVGNSSEDDERDAAAAAERDKIEGMAEEMEDQVCKYEGYMIGRYTYLFFYYLLFAFIWLAKAMYNLLDEETKRKPQSYANMLFSPFGGMFWGVKRMLGGLLWVLVGLKYVFFLVISTFANILFVPVPDWMIEILSFFFSPFIILFRNIPGGFNPFGSVCWKKP